MDYRAGQPGIQATAGGTLLVEGSWYRPALPGPLISATAGLRDHAIGRPAYDTRIAARAPYRLKRKDGPDADGHQRLSCPALGAHPGLMCPLRAASLQPRDGRPKVLTPPPRTAEGLPADRDHHPPDAGASYRQDLPYGSPSWHKRYATLRNTIEGLNGYAKDPARQALAAAGRRHPSPAPAADQPRPGTTSSRATRPPASPKQADSCSARCQNPAPYPRTVTSTVQPVRHRQFCR